MDAPVALLAELTYRCPLRCGYCSNPTDWGRHGDELDTATWTRVMEEAGALGVLHAHLSGGEPLLRDDVEVIAAAARAAGLYVNLITSARGLTEARTASLARSGVDHVQVSFQDADPARADALAGTSAHAHKLAAARWVRAEAMALSVNVVLHRGNLARVEAIIALAAELGAQRLELAHTQYHGSALVNRRALVPTRAQLEHAAQAVTAARTRLRGTMEILYVLPDYFTDLPKPCMDGWGRRFITVIPDGTALPCPGAHALPGMVFDNVRASSLAAIWSAGKDFERFRGTAWMREPCRSCERREIDHGGCRCQAFALAGDPAVTDPACARAPLHEIVRRARDEGPEDEVLYRVDTTRARR